SPDATLAEAILEGLPPSSMDAEQGKSTVGTASSWTKGLVHLLQWVKVQNLASVYSDGVSVNVDADGYIELCAQLYLEDPDAEFWSILSPDVPSGEVTAKLSTIVSSEVFADKHVNAIRVMKHAQLLLPWNEVMAKMIEGLQAGSTLSPALVTVSLTALWELHEVNPTIDAEISNLATQGHVLHHLQHV